MNKIHGFVLFSSTIREMLYDFEYAYDSFDLEHGTRSYACGDEPSDVSCVLACFREYCPGRSWL